MERLGMGAEAIVFRDEQGRVVKERVAKRDRHPLLDAQLRESRTKREAAILRKLPVPGPKLIAAQKTSITMGYVDGVQIKRLLDERVQLAAAIGRTVARLHDHHIIHGDLTTSNMLLRDGTVHLIDFGLSATSHSAEDKAVDLHLLRRAIESKHHRVAEHAWRLVLEGYKESAHAQSVLERYRVVERRGRNKAKF